MTLALVLGGVLVLLAILDQLSNKILVPSYRKPDRTVPDTGVRHEDFEIRSGDHALGSFLLVPEGEVQSPLLLLAHGWGANYSTLLRLAEPLVADGFEVLLFDVRGHGRNPPVDYVTIRHFRDDVIAATEYARGRWPDRPIVLVGHSLGGAASVLAVAEGASADGIVMIAAPSDVMRVTAEYISERGLPGSLMVALLTPFWWRRAGSFFSPLTPSRRLPELDVPVLIIQPEHDRRVALGHAERLSEAAGQPYRLIEGANHNDVLGHDETHDLMKVFLDELP